MKNAVLFIIWLVATLLVTLIIVCCFFVPLIIIKSYAAEEMKEWFALPKNFIG